MGRDDAHLGRTAPPGGRRTANVFVRIGPWGQPDLELGDADARSALVLAQLRHGNGLLRIPAVDYLTAQADTRRTRPPSGLTIQQVRDPAIVICRLPRPGRDHGDSAEAASDPADRPTGRTDVDEHLAILLAQLRAQRSISVPAATFLHAGDDVAGGHRWTVQADNHLELGNVLLRLHDPPSPPRLRRRR